MTPLRRRMIEDMQVRNLAPRTQISYIEQVDRFARHFRKSPVHLGTAEIRAWQLYLAQDKRLAASSISRISFVDWQNLPQRSEARANLF